MRGRKAKPTALHKLHGTFNVTDHRRRNFEPQAETDLSSEPPHWLSDDQQSSYRYALAHAPRGLLKGLDRGVLVAWCVAESRHRQAAMAQARLDAGTQWPLLQPAKDGRPAVSPYVKITEHAAIIMLRYAEALGFTPASRPRIQLIPGPTPPPILEGEAEPDPWEALGRLHGRTKA
jgi:P27 family predicted phage terminase small subunit